MYIISYSQVGINNVAPNSTLDVSALKTGILNIVYANQTVGFQAPRLTLAELITVSGTSNLPKYGINQTGAIVYITNLISGNTGINTNQRELITEIGYYFLLVQYRSKLLRILKNLSLY